MARSLRPTGFETSIDLSSVRDLRGVDLRRLAFDHRVALGLDGRCRVDDAGVAVDEPVEEPAKRRQVEFLGRDAQLHALNVRADVAGGDPRQLQAAALDPGEKFLDGVQVVLAGVGVGDLGLEELLPGELGGAAGGLDDGRCVAGGDRLAPGRQPGLVRTLIDDDLALRIGHFFDAPLLRI